MLLYFSLESLLAYSAVPPGEKLVVRTGDTHNGRMWWAIGWRDGPDQWREYANRSCLPARFSA